MSENPVANSGSTLLPQPALPIGFGTGMLHTAPDRKSALRLLETAFETGITYFDTARLYCDGRAEGMLGNVFSHRRDKVILVSKAGILPAYRSLADRISAKAEHTARKNSFLLRVVREPRRSEPTFGVFDVPSLRKSVETSLRELKTDYLDALLLHECTPQDASEGAVSAFAEELLKEGKIRAYGVAPRIEDALAMKTEGIDFGTVMQIASSAWDDNVAHFPPCYGRLLVTHSIFTRRLRRTIERLRGDEEATGRWRAAFDMEPTEPEAMARLLLRHAHHRNQTGVVIFSTTSAEHIRRNVRATDSPLTTEQAALLCKMLLAL